MQGTLSDTAMGKRARARAEHPERWLQISPTDWIKADEQCIVCRKWMLYVPLGPQRCYVCGTGQQRTILRLDERSRVAGEP